MLDKKRDDIHISSETKSVSTVLQEIGSYRILLPKFQRDYVWGKNNISNLVNSLVMGIPIPPIYLHRKLPTDKQFRIIDGQQRLFGLYLYFNDLFFSKEFRTKNDITNYRLKDIPNLETNEYSIEIEKLMLKHNTDKFEKLLALELMNNEWLKGDFNETTYRYKSSDITFSKLKIDDRLNFLNSSIQIVYITSDEKFSQKVFEMINTTSVGLKEQQLRDCIYFELFDKFYRKIDKINFVFDNVRTYTIVEDAFEILVKYNMVLDKKFFLDSGVSYNTRKQDLLDACAKYLYKNEEKRIKLINDLNMAVELDYSHIMNGKFNKGIRIVLVILVMIYKEKVNSTLMNEVKTLYSLLNIPEDFLSDPKIKELIIEYKIEMHRLKYISVEEYLIEYYMKKLQGVLV